MKGIPPLNVARVREASFAPEAPTERRATSTRAEAGARAVARLVGVLRDALPLLILAVALIGVPVLVFEPQGLPRLRSLERDAEQVDNENRALEREITRLRLQVKLLKDDLPSVERVARQELGLVRKSEIVLQLPNQK